jgi:hypothetical protein
MDTKKLIPFLQNKAGLFPKKWNGRKAILEMKKAGYPHWRQMEWIGFYFQFLCETRFSEHMISPGPSFGKTSFDGFSTIPWDFKAHPQKDAKGKESNRVIANAYDATLQALQEYGGVGIILALGDAVYNDIDRSFQTWHAKLKGGISSYEKEREDRGAPSRLRKTAFSLSKILIITLTKEDLKDTALFQKNFRNSNGTPRKEKVLLSLETIHPVATIHF